jgi:GT2 family glycosyltransferase
MVTVSVNRSVHHDATQLELPRVAVIVPVYNDPAGLSRCVQALSSQTYPHDKLQIIVVDNGSTPPLDLPESEAAIRMIHCGTPGSYAARNAGTKGTHAEVFAFTDADCIPEANWVANGVIALTGAGLGHAVGGEVVVQTPERRTGTGLYQYLTGFQQSENIRTKGFSATANLFSWADDFRRVGDFDERLLSGADREWAWRAKKLGVNLAFAPDARVTTPPRVSLRAAIRQARRVAGGRRHLRDHDLSHYGSDALLPHRNRVQALRWILARNEVSWIERARILGSALTIHCVTFLEVWRLRLGGRPERR